VSKPYDMSAESVDAWLNGDPSTADVLAWVESLVRDGINAYSNAVYRWMRSEVSSDAADEMDEKVILENSVACTMGREVA
jgi:hypothetical protein